MEHRPSSGPGGPRLPRALAAAVLTLGLLTACTGTGQTGDAAPSPAGPAVTATAGPAEPAAAPLREAREGWKVFTDPGRLLSFELPEEWVVQLLDPEPGAYAPDSLHYAVRTPEGVTAAELHTGIQAPEAPCPDAERTPYYVIGSEPLDLTGEAPAGDAGPLFVVRLITGFRFFAAYGITDRVGSEDGLACSLSNTVDGGDALGRISFGDLEVLAPKAPANTGPQTVSFGTIGEAQAFYDTPQFATIREMIRSLRTGPGTTG